MKNLPNLMVGIEPTQITVDRLGGAQQPNATILVSSTDCTNLVASTTKISLVEDMRAELNSSVPILLTKKVSKHRVGHR